LSPVPYPRCEVSPKRTTEAPAEEAALGPAPGWPWDSGLYHLHFFFGKKKTPPPPPEGYEHARNCRNHPRRGTGGVSNYLSQCSAAMPKFPRSVVCVCLLIRFVAYLTGRPQCVRAQYIAVFAVRDRPRSGYSLGPLVKCIWKGQPGDGPSRASLPMVLYTLADRPALWVALASVARGNLGC